MILLWLALTALIDNSLTLVPQDALAGAAWLQLALAAVCAAGLSALTRTLRSVPAFGIQGQWLIIAALLALLLTRGGLPGDGGSIGAAIGLDPSTRQLFAGLAKVLLAVGLWRALSNLARSPEQAVRALEAELHNAMTEMVIETAPRMRPTARPRHTYSGLTDGLTAALEHVAPAHRILRDLILREPNNIAARLALHKRLLEDGTQARAMQLHGDDFVMALRRAGRSDIAINIVEDCVRRDANYFPAAEECIELARYAIAEGRPALALRLLKHFDARHPGHSAVAQAYFSSAEALGRLGRSDAAQSLVDALVAQFPDDPLAADAIALSARWATRI